MDDLDDFFGSKSTNSPAYATQNGMGDLLDLDFSTTSTTDVPIVNNTKSPIENNVQSEFSAFEDVVDNGPAQEFTAFEDVKFDSPIPRDDVEKPDNVIEEAKFEAEEDNFFEAQDTNTQFEATFDNVTESIEDKEAFQESREDANSPDVFENAQAPPLETRQETKVDIASPMSPGFGDFSIPKPDDDFGDFTNDTQDDFADFEEAGNDFAEFSEPVNEPEPESIVTEPTDEKLSKQLESLFNKENIEATVSEIIGESEVSSNVKPPIPFKGSIKGSLGVDPHYSQTSWATVYPKLNIEQETAQFHWKTSQIRKNYLVSLDVPVNLDEIYDKRNVTWDNEKPAHSETDEQIEIRQLLSVTEEDLSKYPLGLLQQNLDDLNRVLQNINQQVNRATEQRNRYQKDIDRHNKMIGSLVFLAQQQRSKK